MSCLPALTEEDEVLTSAHVHFSDVFEVRQGGDPERVVMTFDEMFKQVHGGRKLYFGRARGARLGKRLLSLSSTR